MRKEPTGVILLNLGGPDSLGAVRPFLYNLFTDRQIIRLGPAFMQKPLAWLISTMRAPKAAGYYRLIGGGSPILEITNRQAAALQDGLSASGAGGDFKVYVGMRYWHPFIADTVARAINDGVRRLISLSLYPQYCVATTGSSEASLREAINHQPVKCEFISSFYEHPLYIEALRDVVRRGLAGRKGVHVLCSAHGVPVKFIEEGDPYEEQTMATVKKVAEGFTEPWHLGYQSKVGPVKWLGPSTEEVIGRLAAGGVKDILVVPVSFVSDHVETLYEIDILYKELAEGLGVNLTRAESLNTHPLFIRALQDMVINKAKEADWA